MKRNSVKPRLPAVSGVLIADDDVRLRRRLSDLFALRGFRVTGTGSVDGSIDWLRQAQFDVAIIDMRIPERDGQEVREDGGTVVARLVRHFALVCKDAIVVVFTAFPSVRDCFEVTRAGAYYLPKSVPGKENISEELVQECVRLVAQTKERPTRGRPAWLQRYYHELVEAFGGKTVAVVPSSVASEKRLKGGKKIGECMVFTATAPDRLRDRILRDPKFRQAMPVILDVLEEGSRV